MAIVRGVDAPEFSVPGFNFIGQTSPSRGATEISTWKIEALPGAVSGDHSLDREECFLVLNGKVNFDIGGESFDVEGGDAVSVPAGTSLRLANPGDEPATLIACLPVGTKATMADGEEIGTPPWAR